MRQNVTSEDDWTGVMAAIDNAYGGVRIMSKSVAMETAKYNISCNSVHPGVIWTNMQAQVTGLNDPSTLHARAMGIPLGRAGEPLDIANCIVYCASVTIENCTAAPLRQTGLRINEALI